MKLIGVDDVIALLTKGQKLLEQRINKFMGVK